MDSFDGVGDLDGIVPENMFGDSSACSVPESIGICEMCFNQSFG